jgi:UDP-N-acetylmuramyl pentapeptide phosphotransferase/UDP-N-acetylglucosamine-1-phosphate transferase
MLALISFVYTFVECKPLGLIRDVGTMFLAFGLAYLSVVGGTKIGTVVVALSLVIFDAIWIIWYRICILKKSPMKGDFKHLHHRLLGLGWSR